MASPFSLLDLPAEVLQNVISLLATNLTQDTFPSEPCSIQVSTDWTDLINLSLACRFLHSLTSPIYSRRLLISHSTPLSNLEPKCPLDRHDWLSSATSESEHGLVGQCTRLLHSYKRRLKLVTSARYWEQDKPRPSVAPSELLPVSRALLESIPNLRFLSLCETHSALTDEILRADLRSLNALSLVHLDHKALSPEITYPLLSRLRALKIHSCDPSWLKAIPNIPRLEDLDIYCKLKDPDWFEPALILSNLRYFNIAGSFHSSIIITICQKIQAHRSKGLPFLIEEFGLLTGFNRAIFDEVLLCLAHHPELRSLKLSTLKTKDNSPALLEAITHNGLVNLRRLEMIVTGRGPNDGSPAMTRDPGLLSKMSKLQTLIYQCPAVSHESFDRVGYSPIGADAVQFFKHCPTLETVVHVPLSDCQVVQVCEAHRNRNQALGGEVLLKIPMRPQPSLFESRWAD